MSHHKNEEQEDVQFKKKDQIYRGINVEDLKNLDVRESAKYLTARSRRSILRNSDVIQKFLARCEKKMKRNKKIKTHQRDIIIVPKLVGLTIGVYNGKSFQDLTVTHEMIGHRLGEFALTRNKVNHGEAGIGATKSSRAQKK